ncbi:MAG: F0F1 ATP synthase subunit B [Prochloraceae cyanobacterium]
MGMMGNWLILATEGGGFGLKLDLLDSNLINLAILVGILVFYGKKLVGNILLKRRTEIAEEIQEAEERQRKAAAELSQAQENLAKAQAEAKNIIQAARERAQVAKEAIVAKIEEDIERLQETAQQDLNTEQERAIAELKQRVAAMALERVESQMKAQLDESAQQVLIERSIAQIGGGS